MAHIVDIRPAGGDFVIIGNTLVLPNSSNDVVVGAEPLIGSLRYNPERIVNRNDNGLVIRGSLEIYLPTPGHDADFDWQPIPVDRNAANVMYTTGATMTGDLVMRGPAGGYSPQILVAAGSATLPGLGFDPDHATGLSYDTTNHALIISVQGSPTITVSPAATTMGGSLTLGGNLQAGSLNTNTGTIATLNSTALTAENGTIKTLSSTTGTIGALTSNQIDVVPASGLDPQAVSEITLTTGSQDWVVTHDLDHDLRFRFQNRAMFSIREDSTVVAGAFVTGAADLAERYHADAVYEPGTVLVIGGINEVTACTSKMDPRVAGVVSTTPGLVLNQDAGSDAEWPVLALSGRVPCKVIGPIQKGESLVTSSVPGHAMGIDGAPPNACMVGKALADFPGEGTGVIMIKV